MADLNTMFVNVPDLGFHNIQDTDFTIFAFWICWSLELLSRVEKNLNT